jgi:hypothetical protein
MKSPNVERRVSVRTSHLEPSALSAQVPHRTCRESALLAFNGEHLLPAERPYAWLGSLRPSEAAAGLLAKLGDDVSAAAVGRLHTLQVTEDCCR